MHRNHRRSQNLITVTVGPGSETGLYYILVANLSHSTTWKDLKAFASQACEVDHAEVYPPTSGFVRVRGLANFEKAFKHLNGNTLGYRSLQADSRNKTQSTVVKLLPTDYHAARILRGDTGRIFSEPQGPSTDTDSPTEFFPQDAGTGMSGLYAGFHGASSPAFNVVAQPDTQWAYPYVSGEQYQLATTSVSFTGPGSVAYQTAVDATGAFSHPVATGPQLTIPQGMGYQEAASPAPGTVPSGAAHYPYGTSGVRYSPGAEYVIGGQGYTGYGDAWAPEAVQAAQPGQTIVYGSEDPGVVIEQRKIIIINLEREGLSRAGVVDLIAQHAGIDANAAGQIEKVELPVNKDGRARGIAFVTFGTAELAGTAVAALDGREVAGRKLSARRAEGVSPGGYSSSSRPGRRTAKAGNAAGAAANAKLDRGGAGGSKSTPSPPASASASVSVGGGGGGNGRKEKKEERPVIVDGSGGRWKKEPPPVVVHGSGGKQGHGGQQRSSRH
ncbi:hypothetical protein VTK56DRAFT_6836 [Thermocarpiscus australiensis]